VESCLINQSACERIQGNPVCPKCGMDERVVYPSEADREAAQTAGRARYWEAHARQLEAAQATRESAKVTDPVALEQAPPNPTTAEKLNPRAAWPFPTSEPSATSTAEEPEITSVEDSEEGALRDKTLKRIRNGWIFAGISALMTLFFGVVGPAMDINPLDIDASADEHWYMLIDVVLVVALAFGVYRKNRWAAAALFAYFLFSKITMSLDYESPRPLIQGAVFGYFYFMSMWGCFTWHKRFANEARWPFPTSKTP
jgi:hypothetical protein